jgi:UDP-GlcNAc:undecaprenyl-phosphate GlcNAc-1-phosphate transferase
VRTVVAFVALPVAAASILAILRTSLARRLVKVPEGERWTSRLTPVGGGIGIYAGLLAAVGLAVAVGAVEPTGDLWGILGGVTVLFMAGLVDDVRHLSPLAKLVAQLGAAALVIATGTHVQIVGNDVLAAALAVVWLVGLTNAFNLLDNMDGLAASLALIAATYFAIDAVTVHPSHMALVLALGIAAGCAGFLPFNLRPGRPAAIYMGDAGSQLLGFALAALGLTSSWKVAGTTIATLILPVLILAVPILDTALVTVIRLLEGRPVTQGGRDHSSHRLVRYGLSEKHAVLLLGLVAATLGATSLGYNVLDQKWVTLPAVLLTFVLLVQFGSFLADIEQRPAASDGGFLRTFDVHWRRLVEVVVDFGLIGGSFLAAYYLQVGSDGGRDYQRYLVLQTLPILFMARYVAFMLFGLYRSVWRYAATRDLVAIVAAVVLSELVTAAVVSWTQVLRDPYPQSVYFVDALVCCVLVAATRLGERVVLQLLGRRRSAAVRRSLIVGAGRSGRSLHRELRETPGERVVGFVDDNPRLRRRRLQGLPVRGSLVEMERILDRSRPDVVLVTIPDADRTRLDAVLETCERHGVRCRFVRREADIDPRVALGASSE